MLRVANGRHHTLNQLSKFVGPSLGGIVPDLMPAHPLCVPYARSSLRTPRGGSGDSRRPAVPAAHLDGPLPADWGPLRGAAG